MRFATLWACLLAMLVCMAVIVLPIDSVVAAQDEPETPVPVMDASQVSALFEILDAWPSLGSDDVFGAWSNDTLWSACDGVSAYGILSCNASGFVTELLFTDGVNPCGPLPDAIAQLTALTTFSSYGPINGTLPASWSALTALSTLIISNSQLSGAIPSSWVNLHALSQLTLEWYLPSDSETDPVNLPPVDGIEYVDDPASANIVTWNAGALPLSSLTAINLVSLNLAGQPLPDEFFTSPTLTSLTLDGIAWDGSVPASLFTNNILYNFLLESLSFTPSINGNIPADWSHMTAMKSISITGAPWGGNFPTALPSSLQTLIILDAPNLAGTMPQALFDMGSMRSIIIANAPQLGGDLHSPRAPASSNFTTLYFSAVGFNGTLGAGILSLPKLTSLQIYNIQNWAPQTLPEATACRTTKLIISNAHIVGSIPASLANNCTSLNYFDLSSNAINGSIPEVWHNRLFNTLDLSHNTISGSLPAGLAAKLIAYGYFDVSDNQLTGTVDVGYVDKGYVSFNISYNQLDLCSNAANISENSDVLSGAAFCQINSQASDPCSCVDSWPDICLNSEACANSDNPTNPEDDPHVDTPITYAPDGSVVPSNDVEEGPSEPIESSSSPSSSQPSSSTSPVSQTSPNQHPAPTSDAKESRWSVTALLFAVIIALVAVASR